MAAKDYIDPKGYWCEPSRNIRRMGNEDGEQEVIATVTKICSEAERKALCRALNDPLLRAGLLDSFATEDGFN
jgi:hypothetical protein